MCRYTEYAFYSNIFFDTNTIQMKWIFDFQNYTGSFLPFAYEIVHKKSKFKQYMSVQTLLGVKTWIIWLPKRSWVKIALLCFFVPLLLFKTELNTTYQQNGTVNSNLRPSYKITSYGNIKKKCCKAQKTRPKKKDWFIFAVNYLATPLMIEITLYKYLDMSFSLFNFRNSPPPFHIFWIILYTISYLWQKKIQNSAIHSKGFQSGVSNKGACRLIGDAR